jgi:hypothetical protein
VTSRCGKAEVDSFFFHSSPILVMNNGKILFDLHQAPLACLSDRLIFSSLLGKKEKKLVLKVK